MGEHQNPQRKYETKMIVTKILSNSVSKARKAVKNNTQAAADEDEEREAKKCTKTKRARIDNNSDCLGNDWK